MKLPDLEKFKLRLIALRARLRGEVEHLADAGLNISSGGLSSLPIHLADMGSETYEQDLAISLMESGSEVLEQVEEALDRIKEGTYAICVECGSKIGRARMDALPYTAVCIECASRLERRS